MNYYNKLLGEFFPNCGFIANLIFDSSNSSLAALLKQTVKQSHEIIDFNENGVLIGKIGHLQLIEWKYIENIHY